MPHETNADSKAMLMVRNLSFRYGERVALDDVSFSVDRGRFCALLGPNGAGKSTLIALLTRLLVPTHGDINVAGVNLDKSPRAALAKLGIVFQQPTLDLALSVRRNLTYFAALHGLSGTDAKARIDQALDRLGVLDRANDRVRDLNGGHRRRVEIARALVHDPSILILDEPTVGLDAASRAAITNHVHDLCLQMGVTVFWTTHLVDEIRPGDDLLVLSQGRVLAHDTAAGIAGGKPLANVFLELTAESA